MTDDKTIPYGTPCGKCGEVGKGVLVLVYIKKKNKPFYERKLVCFACWTKLIWEE